jgi:autotransporter-associated beta strand protein
MSAPPSKPANFQAAFPWLATALLLVCHIGRGQTLDTITFGNTTSESAHGLSTEFPAVTGTAMVAAGGGANPSNPSTGAPSDTTTGLLGLSARQLLPRTPNADIYGGQMTFTMAVDPAQQNYFTIKLSGSDTSTQWFVLDCNGYEVGWRFKGDDQEMLWNSAVNWFPGRFIYRTVPLPLNLTTGQTTVTLAIRSLGSIFYYSSGPYFGGYQGLMNAPSLGLYSAYIHTNSYFDASSETQGTSPTVLTPLTSPTQATTVANWESAANSAVTTLLTGSASSMTPANVDFLAQCYGVNWTSGYNNSSVPGAVIAGVDALVTAAASDTNGLMDYMGNFGNPSWGGYFGPVGNAIVLSWPQISGSMSATVAYGGSIGTVTRQSAWSQALRASVDYGRFNRRTITNQEMYCDWNIYRANRGLELVDPSSALNESEALRYLYEATGISPYLGDDQPGEGPVPVRGTEPYGPNWYMVTSVGTTKEDGLVGGDYGEKAASCYAIGLFANNDPNLMAQGLKMLRARSNLRYPTANGANYLETQVSEPVGDRNDQEFGPGGMYPGHVAYLDEDNLATEMVGTDGLAVVGQGASAVGSDLIGYFKQALGDGQYYANLITSQGALEYGPYFPQQLTTALNAAAVVTGTTLLPMTGGQPNFAWADEQNMVVVAKNGSGSSEERFYATLYWRGGTGEAGPNAINGLAKVFDVNAQTAWLGEVREDDVQFVPSGQSVTRNGTVDPYWPPPDNPVNANNGVSYPMALRPDLLAPPPYNRDGGRATGYTLRYGHWLVGMNAHPTNNYKMKLPSGFTSGVDLVSGSNLVAPITLPPISTVVFYLPTTSSSNTLPGPAMYLSAVGSAGGIALSWNPVSGANTYIVQRGTSGTGPFMPIFTGSSTLAYTDSNVVSSNTYYYTLTGSNSSGLGPASNVVSAQAGPTTPWVSADIGAVGVAGGCSFFSDTFALAGSGLGFGSTADACHFVYVPLTGTGSITARLTGVSYEGQEGVMMRQSLAAGSPFILVRSTGNGVKTIWRSGSNGGTSLGASITETNDTAPPWMQIVRNGSTFTTYYSADGNTWTATGNSASITMTDPIYVGMIVSSETNSLSYANYQSVSAPGWGPPAAPSAPVAAISGSNVNLAWNPVTGATSYNIKRSSATTNTGPYDVIAAGVTSTTYTNSSLQGSAAGTSYYYVISALNAESESSDSPATLASVYSPPAAPEVVSTADGAGGKVTLYWDAVSGASFYSVYSSSTSGGPYTLQSAGITGTNYTLTGLTGGTTSYVVITATNAYGQSVNSTEIAVVAGTLSMTGFTPYNGQIVTSSSGVLSVSNTTGTYSTSTVRASSLTVNGGLGFVLANGLFQPVNFLVIGSGSGNTNDIFGPLTLESGAFFGAIVSNTSYNTSVTFTSLTRNPGTELCFDHSSNFSAGLGIDPIETGTNSASVIFINPPNNFMVGGGAVSGTNTISVLPFAFAANPGTNVTSLPCTYDALNGLRALNTTTEMTTLVSGAADAGRNAATGSGTITISGSTTVNSLWVQNAAILGTSILNIASGAIGVEETGTIGVSALSFGSAEGIINVANARVLTLSSAISGSGGLTICLENHSANTATVILSGSNTYTGTTTVEGNNPALAVDLTNASALQDSTLDYNGYGASIQFGIAGGKNLTTATFGGLGGVQNLTLVNSGSSGGGVSLTVGQDGASTVFSGALSGAGSLIKTGAGTLTLSGSNTYTGTTKVSAGGLTINGSLASGSAVTVSSGATLGGTGTIAGPVTVTSGAALAPGDDGAPGVLKLTGSTALNSGSSLIMALGASGSSGQIVLTGAYAGPGSGSITVNISGIASTTATNYTLVTGASGIVSSNFKLGGTPSGYLCALSATSGTLVLTTSTPAAPAGLVATGTTGSVLLSWNPSVSATSYNILRSITSGTGFASLVSVSGSTYTDAAVTNGTAYYYVVNAVNSVGTSPNSAQANVTPLSLLQAWRLANFGTISNNGGAADTACPANDGICNLLKYATGIAPYKPATSVAGPGFSATNSALTLTFNRVADSALTYSVLASTDLMNWQSIWTSSGSQNSSGPVTVTDSSSLSTDPGGFLKLQISY